MDFCADDSTVHSSYKQLNTVQDDLQVGSGNLKDCCFKNDMRIHLKKISVTTIVSRQALTKIDSLNILLDNELMQIDAVCLNVSRRITLLKLLSKYVDQKSLNNITTAIFYLYLITDVLSGVDAQLLAQIALLNYRKELQELNSMLI